MSSATDRLAVLPAALQRNTIRIAIRITSNIGALELTDCLPPLVSAAMFAQHMTSGCLLMIQRLAVYSFKVGDHTGNAIVPYLALLLAAAPHVVEL